MHFIHTKTSLQMRIIEREQRTAEQMIRIYCRYKEGNKELCPTCRQLLQYAHNRLKHCTFGEQKKTCRNCPIHCYKPEMKKRIQEVMRYAGPRISKQPRKTSSQLAETKRIIGKRRNHLQAQWMRQYVQTLMGHYWFTHIDNRY